MFVLDTNTLIYFFKGMGHVAEHLLRTSSREIALPSIMLYELEVGIAKSSFAKHRRKQLEEVTHWITIIPFGVEEARTAARIRAELEATGTPIGPMDTLIAGTALTHRATLVTRNVREFGRVRELGLVNWYDEPPPAEKG